MPTDSTISSLPPGTPVSNSIITFVDRVDGVTKRADISELPISGSGDMLSTNNLSDVASVATARTNLDVYSTGETDALLDGKLDSELTNITSTDINTITTIGRYCLQASCTNLPESGVKTMLEVCKDPTVSTQIMQIGKTATAIQYIRVSADSGANWTAWTTAKFGTTAGTVLEGDKDATYVKLTGDQSIAGIKTFSSSPIVPTPTTDYQTATKKYVDDNTGGGGEWTLIETLTPSAVTTFDSATFTAYDRLRIEISMDTSISTTVLGLRFNTYSGVYNFRRINGTTIQASSGFQIDITNFAQSYLFIGELFIAGKGVQKPFYANGSQYTTDVQVIGGTITGGLAADITQLNFLRSSGTGTFTGTVNIYGKNY